MTLFDVRMGAEDAGHIQTELFYAVAHTAAKDAELLRLTYSSESCERVVLRLLRKLKREGRIRVFATSEELRGQGAEARYLINKFPSLLEDPSEPRESYVLVRV